MKKLYKGLYSIMDFLFMIVVYPASLFLKMIRKVGIENLPKCKKGLLTVGIFPIQSHYYEPLFDYRGVNLDHLSKRELPGIDFNISGQLELLKKFKYSNELINVPNEKTNNLEYYFNNGTFGPGDAEYWYQLIRTKKPEKIFEIGSGNSTLMAIKAIKKNKELDSNYTCQHVCIEPYEMPWLEETGVSLIRRKVEDVEPSFFLQLNDNDILFIDSSHIIRPHGDVLFEYLEVLPILNKGVIVHVHDIFTPNNYPVEWLTDKVRFWNEQYLLEAFLSHNRNWQVIGALNYLHHNHFNDLKSIANSLSTDTEPGSFYFKKIN